MKPLPFHLFQTAVCAALFAGSAAAAPGDLDGTFGVGGRVVDPFPGLNSAVTGLVMQNDGKIVAVGGDVFTDIITSDFQIMRFLDDGTPDLTFGNGGRVSTDFGHFEAAACAAVDAGGRIIVAGQSRPGPILVMSRYLPNGSLDATFADSGMLTAGSVGMGIYPKTVIPLADGKILVGAGSYINGVINTVLVRFQADGTTDTAFGNSGKLLIPGARIGGMALTIDGKIVIGGSEASATSGNFRVRDASLTGSWTHPSATAASRFRRVFRVLPWMSGVSLCRGMEKWCWPVLRILTPRETGTLQSRESCPTGNRTFPLTARAPL